MQIRYLDQPDLPPLAWLAIASVPEQRVSVLKGRNVETGDGFFVDGVWDGEFAAGAFDETDIFFGSGMRVRGEKLIFLPSSSTVDALHYRYSDGTLIVSNSLPFLLAACGDRLDPQCRDYPRINESIAEGIIRVERDIPTLRGGVRRAIYYNLVLSADGLAEVEKPMPPAFPDFRTYRDYLKTGLHRLLDNAMSPDRRTPLGVLSSQSRGYDSTAINALLPPDQVDAVFTIPLARTEGRYSQRESDQAESDSGEDICRQLGLPCRFIDSFHIEDKPDAELLCFAGEHRGGDANLVDVFERAGRPSVFLTGAHGGGVWAIDPTEYSKEPDVNTDLVRKDTSLSGLTEMRLDSSVIQIAVPFMGARAQPEIAAISNSEEMDPWRLNVPYDRPIPRRIAEEAGVDRKAFGQKKRATAIVYTQPEVPKSPVLRANYFRYLREKGFASALTLALMPLWIWINSIIRYHSPRRYRALYYFERLVVRLTGRPYRIPYLLRRLNGSLFCYCVNLRADHYARLVESSGFLEMAETGGASDSR